MKISIIIVNWRSKDYVRRCILSIKETCQELSPEIIVVDGGSFDGCGKMLAREFPDVVFVQSEENLGFGRANNLGFQRCSGEAVWFLNPDTEVRHGAGQALLRFLKNSPGAGILGARLLNTDGTFQATCVRALPTPLNRALDSEILRRLLPNSRLWGMGEASRANAPLAVEAVSGACIFMRSEVFRHVGGFSSEFFMYGEDMDLCAKVKRLGLRNYHVPAAVVVHHGGGSSAAQPSQFSTMMMRMAGETYMRLNHGRVTAFFYRILQILSATCRLTIAIPAAFLWGSGGAAARATTRKWWYVLRWALGTEVAINGHLDMPASCKRPAYCPLGDER